MLLTSEWEINKIFPTCSQFFQPLNTFNKNIRQELFSSSVEQKQIWNFFPVHKAKIVLLQLALVMLKGNLNKAGLKKDSEIKI